MAGLYMLQDALSYGRGRQAAIPVTPGEICTTHHSFPMQSCLTMTSHLQGPIALHAAKNKVLLAEPGPEGFLQRKVMRMCPCRSSMNEPCAQRIASHKMCVAGNIQPHTSFMPCHGSLVKDAIPVEVYGALTPSGAATCRSGAQRKEVSQSGRQS